MFALKVICSREKFFVTARFASGEDSLPPQANKPVVNRIEELPAVLDPSRRHIHQLKPTSPGVPAACGVRQW